MADLIKEIEKRRTFAIISHPDAGKTTLTEKLLLYGGAIRLAGSVKARKASKHAVSDWMEIEKQRGISVTSSVMQFNYNNYCINILDTPGHQDFSEDTYRTLMAADSAVMVIDAAKGVEAQTKKLFNVCSLRGIPIFTFINKMDRESKDPFDLMEDIENVLGIKSYPINWPIGSGKDFKGVYDRKRNLIEAFNGGNHGQTAVTSIEGTVEDAAFKDLLGEPLHKKLQEDIELLDIAGDEFNMEEVKKGLLTPVFFGSALTNFGVEPFLKEFLNLTTPPLPRKSDIGEINAFDSKFSAFVFKIQANMNPAHRDRIAFMRICSGKFKKGMEVFHMQGKNKVKLSQPQQFLAQDREIVEEAYAGDIIGVFDPGIYSIGDTLCSPDKKFRFESIPVFAPEHFARVKTIDTMKRKQFIKGITEISQEGAIQVFKELNIGIEEIIIGVVGLLQFEVLQYRMKNEYNTDIKIDVLPYRAIRWIENSKIPPENLILTSDTKKVKDLKGRDILIFQSEWNISWALEHNKGLELSDIGKTE
ncbi:peptide chain release factor 3 [Clostridium luticellarii]|uniref:Peptide chain release factor 3 n=1 Tax=Clostridium luticellarii TaxID=1691940 RepID=A0A2T0BNC3_9CLOT|nr:peptide chain release factor 3 [Clostridium luticellarii]MCI1945447.1 peptide chain release factor 3 [Clostridium luticellarii]MCI1968780.1 peptide chain release factor 3 [Clostridium luticellarii]MCI1994946.1 peptide chain release factor 3 [Clostridium luticellarii]MCI2040207.1 peptide chain release factor 3 [Clostridium luticellarii]PRR85371.1 Peptide chain release factor 3 [Clostridium luticellarii]